MRKVSAETRKEKLLNVLVRDWAGSADAEALSRYLGAFVDGDFVRFAAATPESVDRLKFSPFRVVLRLHGRQEVIVKLYRRSGSRPRREADGLDRARRLGLPCPEPLAWQDARGSGRDPGFLIIRDLGAGRALDATLESALDSAADPAARARAVELCHEAGELIARACRVGLVHRDLHLGNVFVDQADKPWLLDLHGARFKDRPTVPRLADFMPLYLSIPWPEQAAFRQALFVELGLPATPGRLPDWLLKHLDKRVHRCLRDSGTFLRQGRSARRLGFAGSAETWRSELECGELLKQGRRGRIVRSRSGVGKLRASRAARRLWLASHALEIRRIPTPRSLAFFPAGPGRCWLLIQDVRGSTTRIGDSECELPSLAASLGRALGRIHATGWRCRDPRGDNLRSLQGTALILDLDGVLPCPRWQRRSAATADLGRLLAWARHQAPLCDAEPGLGSRLPRLMRCFLRAYLRERRQLGRRLEGLRSFANAIQVRSSRWKRRHASDRSGTGVLREDEVLKSPPGCAAG